MVTYDPFALIADSSLILQTRNFNADVLTKSWKVEEDVVTGWVKFDVDTQIGSVPVKGNFGTQIVYTDQSSTGFRAQGAAPSVLVDQFTDGDEYTKIYPSANLQFEMADDFLVRVGAARTYVRPRLDQMNASQTIGRNFAHIGDPFDPGDPTATFFSGSGGNPQLRPWVADSFDLSFEKYFADGAGYFAVAGFYKHLETFIFSRPIDGFDFGTVFLRAGEPQPANTLGRLTVQDNGQGGYVRGVEISTSVPFDVFSEGLDGFGLLASYSFTDSNIEANGPGSGSRLPGLSKHVVNATLYFEKNGYEARVSNRYRSNFLGEVAGFGNGRDFRQLESENIIDAQIGYRFQSGALEGLHIVLQGQNLTDQEFRTINGGDPLQVVDNQRFGRTFLFGIDYSL
jgi:iron complex outermembrane receptor protein